MISVIDPPYTSDLIKHGLAIAAVAVLLVAIPGFMILGGLEGGWRLKRSFRIEVSDDKIIQKRKDASPVELPLGQIKSIFRSPGYLIIAGGEPPKRILVPKQIADYKELERKLAAFASIENLEVRRPWRVVAVVAIAFAACVFLAVSRNRAVIAASAGTLLVLQALGIHSLTRLRLTGQKNKYAILAFYISGVLATLWLAYSRFKL